jgi:hypothetical protein
MQIETLPYWHFEKTEVAIKNVLFRDTVNIVHTRHRTRQTKHTKNNTTQKTKKMSNMWWTHQSQEWTQRWATCDGLTKARSEPKDEQHVMDSPKPGVNPGVMDSPKLGVNPGVTKGKQFLLLIRQSDEYIY